MRSTVLLTLCLIAFMPSPAQQPATQIPPVAMHAFEVISIRPSGKDSNYSFFFTQDGFRASRQTLWSLISLAYLPMPLWSHDRIQNAPDWAGKQEYDIVAKVAPEYLSSWTGPDKRKLGMVMLQAMLADRFKLSLHIVPAEVPGFALVTASHGAKLKIADPNEPLPKPAMNLSHGGVAVATRMGGPTDWTFYAAPIASLVDYLAMGAHTLIEDRTGLTGRYDFKLPIRDDADRIDRGERTDPANTWNLENSACEPFPQSFPPSTSLSTTLNHPVQTKPRNSNRT